MNPSVAGPATGPVLAATAALGPVTLDQVLAGAPLLDRTDRKYVLCAGEVAELVAALPSGVAALEIDGRRSFSYESVYFDTPDLASYRGAAHGRRRRFKVRARTYLDSGSCVLEVKLAGGRGETVKHRTPHPAAEKDRLGPAALAFLSEHAVGAGLAAALGPTLVTTYQRATLVDLDAGYRLTIDSGLTCRSPGGESVAAPGAVVVETKSALGRSPADRVLWAMGRRPVAISKYATGLAALFPSLPANRWARTVHVLS
ncbi:MAG: polyphosphate polymerase domain-containing protein [Actinomycetota bacterium]